MLNFLRTLLSIFSSFFQWRRKEEKEYALNFGSKGYFFNPTFFISQDKIRFITRTVKGERRRLISSSIALDEIRNKTTSLDMENIKYLEIDADWPADPRYFMFKSKRYLTFNSGHFERPNKLYIQEISDEGGVVGTPIVVSFKERREIEKNWSFFEKDGRLYTVYSICPFKVLKVDLDFVTRKAVCHELVSYAWNIDNYQKKYGELRGGCSPIRYGESYLFVVQSNVLFFGKSIYTANLLQFDENTFEPQKIGAKPVFLMTFSQIYIKPLKMLNKRVFTCIYPTGMQIIGDKKLLVSFGINDYQAVLRIYSLDSVFSSLLKNIKILND